MSNIRKISFAPKTVSCFKVLAWLLSFVFLSCQPHNITTSQYAKETSFYLGTNENTSLQEKRRSAPFSESTKSVFLPVVHCDDWEIFWKFCQTQDKHWEKENIKLITEYKAMRESSEQAPIAFFLTGRLLGLLGKTEQARWIFQKGVEKFPLDFWNYYGLGLYFWKKNSVFYAKIYWQKCLDLCPKFAPAYIGLAKLLETDDPNMAQKYLLYATEHSPCFAETYQHLGNMFLGQDSAKAIEYLEKAHSLDNINIEILRDLANAYLKIQDYTRAYQVLEKMLAIPQPDQQRNKIEHLMHKLKD